MNNHNEQLQRIEDKLTSVQLDVARNTISLDVHMKRTEASEVRITYLERVFMGITAAAVLGGLVKLLVG